MKNNKGLIPGIVLVLIGVLLGLKSLNILDFNIFFDGWWTLFIIVPSFIGLFQEKDKSGNVIGLIVGTLILLGCQGVLNFELIFKLMVPSIIIVVGLSLIFKNTFSKDFNKKVSKINKGAIKGEYNAMFSSQKIKVTDEFDNAVANAVFGSVSLDIIDAGISKDLFVEASSIFGSIDIIVPKNVNVVVKSNSLFGGVSNKTKGDNKEITLYVNATAIFGGVNIYDSRTKNN